MLLGAWLQFRLNKLIKNILLNRAVKWEKSESLQKSHWFFLKTTVTYSTAKTRVPEIYLINYVVKSNNVLLSFTHTNKTLKPHNMRQKNILGPSNISFDNKKHDHSHQRET